MITITLKPLHLAIIAAFIGGILVAGAAVLAFNDSDDPGQSPAEPSLANVNEPPTLAPTSPPPSETPEPSPEPTDTPEPTPEEKDEPEIRSCAEIEAAGTYNSPEERQFFLDNCTSSGPSSNPAPAVQDDDDEPAPASSSSNATADEQHYRGRASAIVSSFGVRIGQYYNSPSHGVTGDILDFGVVLRRFAIEIDGIQNVPPRFQQVHDQLVGSLIATSDFIMTFVNVNIESEAQLLNWIEEYIEYAEAMVGALDDFALVLGIELPPELAE
jgi:hypothetical protein